MVSGGVGMVSGWGLRVSGDVLIPGYQDVAITNPLAKFKLGYIYCHFFQNPLLQKCLCLGVSGWRLRVSG